MPGRARGYGGGCSPRRFFWHRQFNVLWLNPEDPDTFPEGLLDALDDPALVAAVQRQRTDHSLEGRLRAKMQADALRPLKASLDDVDADEDAAADKAELRSSPYSEEELQEAVQFLRLGVRALITFCASCARWGTFADLILSTRAAPEFTVFYHIERLTGFRPAHARPGLPAAQIRVLLLVRHAVRRRRGHGRQLPRP